MSLEIPFSINGLSNSVTRQEVGQLERHKTALPSSAR